MSMKKNLCIGLGLTLAFALHVNAQTCPEGQKCYPILKVGSEEEKSFDIIKDGKVVTEVPQGHWVTVSPNVPDGKIFKGFTVYDEYGETEEEQKKRTTGISGMRFAMPADTVYVKVSYESLRYYINTKKSDHGSVSVSFNDRSRDRTKPGIKVTVKPKADDGYKVASIKVSKYLDSKVTVTCTKSESSGNAVVGPGSVPVVPAADGSCVFEMPNYDVDVSATFVADSVKVTEVDLKDKKFKVTYELNGGMLSGKSEEKFACTEMAELPTPTKEGYEFVGWTLENKLDNVYYALKLLDGTACTDTKLYANWIKKGSCTEQKAIAVDSSARLPVCTSEIRCALVHIDSTNRDSVCNGVLWVSDLSLLPASSSSVSPSSSSVAPASSSVAPASSSVAPASSSAKPASSSAAAPASSSVAPASSSVAPASSSAKPASSSAAAPASSSVAPASSSAAPASSSAKPASSSAAAPASSSVAPASCSVAPASSSAKPASSSAKASSSSSKKASSSSSKAKSSSSVEVVVESVETEEDLPSCTEKRQNVTYYVTKLKTVFVCKDRKWTKFDPNGIPAIARVAKFSAVVSGRQLQITGAKIGASVSLFDMQGSVMYNGRVDAPNFTMNVLRSGSCLLRIGTQQKIVNIR